jgi:outer membrane protein assembly factor BamA
MRWLWFVLAGAISAMVFPSAVGAQSPREPDCTPVRRPVDPPLRGETKDMQGGTPEEASHPKVRVEEVTVEGAPDLQEVIRARIDDRFPEGGFESDSLWIDALAETAKEVLQDNGYFCAKVSAQAHIWSSDAAEEQVSVTLQVAEGQQYRLGEIQFTRAQVFPPSELRNRVPLQDGDVFDLGKIRQGLVVLNHLYSSLGYINFIAFPDIKIDDDLQYISVVFEIHEAKQYRVGSVEVLGLDREISDHALSIKLKPGDVFNPQFVKNFYNDNKSL